MSRSTGVPRFSARWIVGTVLVASVVAGCVAAGFWQLRRLDERRGENRRIEERSARVQPLPASGFAGAEVDDLVYRRVAITGAYAPEHEFLVRFRTHRGLPGYEVVTPLDTARGAVLVNRGWVPVEVGDRWPEASAAPPTGQVSVEGVLAIPDRGEVREQRGQGRPMVVSAVDVDRVGRLLPYDRLYRLPVLLRNPSAEALPVPVDPPDLSEGPHLSYAIQWFSFAAIGTVGWATLLRRRGPLRPRDGADRGSR